MAVRPVLKMGETSLLERSVEVTAFNSKALDDLIVDMWDTMAAENGAGLAAPQIGVNQRVVIFGCQLNPRYPEAPPVPETVLINPIITPLDDETDYAWEGCLSVPEMRGLVPRYRRIHYQGFDATGAVIDREADDFHARVVQHECDHLDGILYPLRIEDMQYFGFCQALEANDYLHTLVSDER